MRTPSQNHCQLNSHTLLPHAVCRGWRLLFSANSNSLCSTWIRFLPSLVLGARLFVSVAFITTLVSTSSLFLFSFYSRFITHTSASQVVDSFPCMTSSFAHPAHLTCSIGCANTQPISSHLCTQDKTHIYISSQYPCRNTASG